MDERRDGGSPKLTPLMTTTVGSFPQPPDTDRDRVAELRKAFDGLAKDPEVLEPPTNRSSISIF